MYPSNRYSKKCHAERDKKNSLVLSLPWRLQIRLQKGSFMDLQTVKKVATLARLEMPDSELEAVRIKIGNIMKFVEQLAEVNTDNVVPLANVVDIKLRLREDKINDGNQQDKVLANAPEAMEGFFVVSKIVE
jgi:aspartyl-tRNA(Asn)/glutamyl-tRNA(Gln) amidotransferase subunit C